MTLQNSLRQLRIILRLNKIRELRVPGYGSRTGDCRRLSGETDISTCSTVCEEEVRSTGGEGEEYCCEEVSGERSGNFMGERGGGEEEGDLRDDYPDFFRSEDSGRLRGGSHEVARLCVDVQVTSIDDIDGVEHRTWRGEGSRVVDCEGEGLGEVRDGRLEARIDRWIGD